MSFCSIPSSVRLTPSPINQIVLSDTYRKRYPTVSCQFHLNTSRNPQTPDLKSSMPLRQNLSPPPLSSPSMPVIRAVIETRTIPAPMPYQKPHSERMPQRYVAGSESVPNFDMKEHFTPTPPGSLKFAFPVKHSNSNPTKTRSLKHDTPNFSALDHMLFIFSFEFLLFSDRY